jgi:hypothetical protein
LLAWQPAHRNNRPRAQDAFAAVREAYPELPEITV